MVVTEIIYKHKAACYKSGCLVLYILQELLVKKDFFFCRFCQYVDLYIFGKPVAAFQPKVFTVYALLSYPSLTICQ